MTVLFGDQFWWYLARSGGIVALLLSTLSVIWGLLLSSRYLAGGAKPKGLLDVHKFLGGLTVIFTAIHVLALYFDSFVEFGLTSLFVPFASSWRPMAVAMGVVAFWLLVAIQLTSMVMHRIPRRWWKVIHLGSFLMLPLGLGHAVLAGSDAATGWFRLGAAALAALVCYLGAWRAIAVPKRAGRPARADAVI